MTLEPANRLTFTDDQNRKKTVAKYFEEAYGKLKYPNLPCLDVSKVDKIIYLPLEVCEILPGQRQKRLTDEQTRKFIAHSAIEPSQRKGNITETLNKVKMMNGQAINAYKTDIDDKMIKV